MKIWNDYAIDYDQKVGETGDLDHKNTLNPKILELLGDVQDKTILDLGCGNGYFSRMLAEKGANITGIDISSDLIEIAIKRTKEQKLDIRYVVSDASDIKAIESNKFDIIVSNMAFMDIENIDDTVKECSRLVENNGILLFSIVNPLFGIFERQKDEHGHYLKLTKYKTETTITNENRGYNFETVHYHRPIGFYINTLARNNFLITNYEEISTKYFKGKEVDDQEFLDFIQEFPSFLIIKAIKRI